MTLKNKDIEGKVGKGGYICAPFETIFTKNNCIIIPTDNQDNYEGIFTGGIDTCIPAYFFYSSEGDEQITHLGMYHLPGSYNEYTFKMLMDKFRGSDNTINISDDTIKIGIYINTRKYLVKADLERAERDFYSDVDELYKLSKENIVVCKGEYEGFAINFKGEYGEFQAPGVNLTSPFCKDDKSPGVNGSQRKCCILS